MQQIETYIARGVAILVISSSCFVNTLHATERTVVLKNGNVLQGEVQQLANQIIIRTQTTQLRFAASDVELVERSLEDVYRKKAGQLPPRPAAREALILWCLKHGLTEMAKSELQTLRHRHPNYPTLDVLEKRVRTFRTELKHTTLPTKSALHPDAQFTHDRAGQLSKQTMSRYVQNVQPLLMNRCGQAACHGKATESAYRLIGSSRSTMSKNATYRNLGATLQQVDAPTRQSLLWMSASSLHGGMKKEIPVSELKKLYAWIDRVANETGVKSRTLSGVRQASANLPTDGVDPFDPAEFNSLSATN